MRRRRRPVEPAPDASRQSDGRRAARRLPPRRSRSRASRRHREGVADAVLATPDDVQPILDQLVVDGLCRRSRAPIRLTEAGTIAGRDLLRAPSGDAWGIERGAPRRSTPSSASTSG